MDHFLPERSGRPIALVGYGGVAGGLRSIEHLAFCTGTTITATTPASAPHLPTAFLT
nr:hypothetical protein [Halopolyspora algeriensis]